MTDRDIFAHLDAAALDRLHAALHAALGDEDLIVHLTLSPPGSCGRRIFDNVLAYFVASELEAGRIEVTP